MSARPGRLSTSFKFPAELLDRVRREADSRSVPHTRFIFRALTEYLAALDRLDRTPSALKNGLPKKRVLGSRAVPPPADQDGRRPASERVDRTYRQFWFPQELLERLRREADSRGVTLARLTFRALTEYLDALVIADLAAAQADRAPAQPADRAVPPSVTTRVKVEKVG